MIVDPFDSGLTSAIPLVLLAIGISLLFGRLRRRTERRADDPRDGSDRRRDEREPPPDPR